MDTSMVSTKKQHTKGENNMPTSRWNNMYCQRCEEHLPSQQASFSYGDDWYCEGCYERECEENGDPDNELSPSDYNGIHSYGYHPEEMTFHHGDGHTSEVHTKDDEVMFGIELETEYTGNQGLIHGINYINKNTSGLVYLKEDGSINYGFEIVSNPMSLQYLQVHGKQYADMLKYLRTNNYRAWKTSTCGLHIHISKISFADAKHEMKFIYFMFKNKKELVTFAGRNSGFARYDYNAFINANDSQWRGKKPNILECVKGVMKDGEYAPGSYERNLAVNRSNRNTHELRIFRPSLRMDTVLAYMEFTHCLFSYSKVLTSNEILKNKGLDFAPLMEYANSNSAMYQNFIKKVKKRNVLTEGDK